MASTGYFQVHAFASSAQLPLRDVAVVVTATDGTAIAMRLTDRSGLTAPIEIPVPDLDESQEPGADMLPYTQINLYAYRSGYERFVSQNIQVFPDTTTYQELEMIPLSEEPYTDSGMVQLDTPPQDL